MKTLDIQQVRSFNRIVAEGIGAIDDSFLGRGRPMGESRLLWEIGPDGADLRALRERLDLDSGYLSRILGSLERQGLVAIEAHPDDRRVRRILLTRSGLKERAELDRLSDTVAVRVLDPLSESQRVALLAAMAEVERLLQPSLIRFEIEDPASDDARWCFEQYFTELNARFEAGFDPSSSLPADTHELTAPHGALIVARLRGNPVGCVALKFHKKSPAELKRMWVSSSVRGLGVGRRLLDEAEKQGRKSGARVIRLETNRTLSEAINLYRRCGYVEVDPFSAEPYAHHWFEKKLT
ncbi:MULTISPECIES: helix-turn-helix domain-containing GNAT family N-acetyltransferase [Paraburkholderia]|uniref:bifunctional helix-turn-helix transcriptional regulator/GNAT family N-acetyltransferase n=1 Tax=Paraburkholderia TaxID=1822464 RepID=UPI0022557294|nr:MULTISPECIES: helix-turn-helix domain-containing GNAT family N-acetyltransferase [Paraburkholderia]MCX4162863.1 helix-turn-helix domain-containing GNAT family N-acetyltransferase [Paraburkholderia megapolitana]MDN7158359.1 bifunctional helix-turn-helix transcriptional regulator/GNAT family N-acetyltransferase [Paraburkholderia sp. CHISQ3]MDQ6495406.1 bifunctional helix-turn-helix transcriptional regulator/GNAT family N-acetyltransferase [Paraburkholderia megapolitana]